MENVIARCLIALIFNLIKWCIFHLVDLINYKNMENWLSTVKVKLFIDICSIKKIKKSLYYWNCSFLTNWMVVWQSHGPWNSTSWKMLAVKHHQRWKAGGNSIFHGKVAYQTHPYYMFSAVLNFLLYFSRLKHNMKLSILIRMKTPANTLPVWFTIWACQKLPRRWPLLKSTCNFNKILFLARSVPKEDLPLIREALQKG